jgi:hypothetical protein
MRNRVTGIRLVPVLVVLLAAARPAGAQVFGQFAGARPVTGDAMPLGTHVTFQDNALRWVAQGRMAFGERFDAGLQFGLLSVDAGSLDRTDILIGLDGKYLIVEDGEEIPFDISIDGGIGVALQGDVDNPSPPPSKFDGGTVTLFHVSGQTSKTFELSNGHAIVPYASLVLVVSRFSIDIETPSGTVSESDTDTDASVRFGTTYELSKTVSLLGEVEIGDDATFGAGLSFVL